MRTFNIPPSQIEERLLNLQEHIRINKLDGVLIIQRVDLIYFCGTAQNGCLYVPAHKAPLLFIKRSHSRACKESPLKNILRIQSIKEVPVLIRDFFSALPLKLGLELDVMPVNQFRFIESLFPGCRPMDASGMILGFHMDETRMFAIDALEPKMVVENEFTAGVESVFAVTTQGTRLISRVPVQIFIS